MAAHRPGSSTTRAGESLDVVGHEARPDAKQPGAPIAPASVPLAGAFEYQIRHSSRLRLDYPRRWLDRGRDHYDGNSFPSQNAPGARPAAPACYVDSSGAMGKKHDATCRPKE